MLEQKTNEVHSILPHVLHCRNCNPQWESWYHLQTLPAGLNPASSLYSKILTPSSNQLYHQKAGEQIIPCSLFLGTVYVAVGAPQMATIIAIFVESSLAWTATITTCPHLCTALYSCKNILCGIELCLWINVGRCFRDIRIFHAIRSSCLLITTVDQKMF